MAAVDIVKDALGSASNRALSGTSVLIRTNLNANSPLVIKPFSADASSPAGPPQPQSFSDWIVAQLQPQVIVEGLPTGSLSIDASGAPTRDDLPVLLIGLGLAALTFMGLGAIVKIPWYVTLIAGTGTGIAGIRLLGR